MTRRQNEATSCRRTITQRRPRPEDTPSFPSSGLLLLGGASVFAFVGVGVATVVAWQVLGLRETLPGVMLLVGSALVGYEVGSMWLEEE